MAPSCFPMARRSSQVKAGPTISRNVEIGISSNHVSKLPRNAKCKCIAGGGGSTGLSKISLTYMEAAGRPPLPQCLQVTITVIRHIRSLGDLIMTFRCHNC